MKITHKTQIRLRLQKGLFYLLLVAVIALLAKASIDHNQQYDWTANSRHTLSDATKQLLAELDGPVRIEAFASPDYQFRNALGDLLDRYGRLSEHIEVSFIDPAFAPDKVRQMNIQQQGEIVVSRGEHRRHVFDMSEQSLTNALVSVSRIREQWLVFIEGHGERSLFADHNHSLSTWSEQLKNRGFGVQSINLVEQSALPDNTAAVVIASSQRDWLPGEVRLIVDYLDQGGNLLWLVEPEQDDSLAPIAEALGLRFINGTVLDPSTTLLGIDDPRFVLISDYANHPVGLATASVSLLVEALAMERLEDEDNRDWHYVQLLNSQPDAWVETDPVSTSSPDFPVYDPGADFPGPLTLGYALSRSSGSDDDTEQRVAVIGDGDFLANAYIGNVANLDLGMALANWVAHDDALIDIPAKTTIGGQLLLSRTQALIIGLGFLAVLPLVLLSIGLLIWWRRRRR